MNVKKRKYQTMRKTLLSSFGVLMTGSLLAQSSLPSGHASNIFTSLRPSQNQVFADPASGTVVFIHRQDINLFGGVTADNGRLRYSISTDGGSSITEDVGILNSTYTRATRYPQVLIYNPNNATDGLNTELVWAAPTLQPSLSGWDGHANGLSATTLTTPSSTENYQFQSMVSGLPGGLSQRPGTDEFFMVESPIRNDSTVADSIFLYKGVYNSQTSNVDWSRDQVLTANTYKGFDGTGRQSSPNLAFSPDGNTAWVGALGDLIGGADSVYHPILYRSTDGGVTWGSPIEVQLENIPWIMDSLTATAYLSQSFDTVLVTSPTTTFDFDLTVDANGNPHFFCTVGAAEVRATTGAVQGAGKQYSIYPFYTPMMVDIYSTDGGLTWDAHYISPLNTFRTDVPDDVTIDAYPQIARNQAGDRIFFSWSDTDTLLAGSTIDNIAPNLRIAALRISDGFQTCYKRIEGNINEDGVLTPTMSPLVLEDNGKYTLPVVSARLISNANSPVEYHYLGLISTLCEDDFKDPSTLDYTYSFNGECYNNQFCENVSIEEHAQEKVNWSVFPNPANQSIQVDLSAFEGKTVDLKAYDLNGRMVADFGKTNQSTYSANVSSLSNGTYILEATEGENRMSLKFIVQH